MEKYCLFCGKPIGNRLKYCSKKCRSDYQYIKWVTDWKNGKESGLRGEYGVSYYLKKYLFLKYDSKCTICGWSQVNPFTGLIPLEVEHIDGNYLNNSEDNLTLLCPNCHSLTKTAKGSNRGNGRKSRKKYWDARSNDLTPISFKNEHECVVCGKLTKNKFTCSRECEAKRRKGSSKNRPTKETLIDDLRTLSMTGIGHKYGVSDNAVRKWCKFYNLPYRKEDIKTYFNVSTFIK